MDGNGREGRASAGEGGGGREEDAVEKQGGSKDVEGPIPHGQAWSHKVLLEQISLCARSDIVLTDVGFSYSGAPPS